MPELALPPQKKHLTSSRCESQEASQIKEDLKNKQMLKDMEAKRRGSSLPLRRKSPSETMIYVFI